MKFISPLLMLLVTASRLKCVGAAEESGNNSDVSFSPKCAAALVSAAGVGMGGAAFVLTPAVLSSAGFCPGGVAGGSFASWWQSTMPIAKGGIFAQLQSLAMTGNGLGTITVASSALGGAVGATIFQDVCAFVDDTDPDSVIGKALDMNLKAVAAAIQPRQSLESHCAASKTCATAKEALEKSAALLETQCAASETCRAAEEAGAAAVKLAILVKKNLQTAVEEAGASVGTSIWSKWNSFTSGLSTQATNPDTESEEELSILPA